MRLRQLPWWRAELRIAGITLAGIFVLTMVAAFVAWRSGWSQPDRLTAVGDTLAAGGLALALFAAVVATLAYGAAIEQPTVLALLTFPGSDTNAPVLVTDPTVSLPAEWQAVVIADFDQVNCEVRLQNQSTYTARSPLVRIELMNMRDLQASGFWTLAKPNVPGAKTALRWSSGQDQSVPSLHGGDIAPIGTVSFKGVIAIGDDGHEIVVQIFAEGYRAQDQRIAVVLQSPDEWVSGRPERVEQLPTHLQRWLNGH